MKQLLISAIVIFGLACSNSEDQDNNSVTKDVEQEISFNEEKWKTKTGKDYPFREYMLADLMSSEEFRHVSALLLGARPEGTRCGSCKRLE